MRECKTLVVRDDLTIEAHPDITSDDLVVDLVAHRADLAACEIQRDRLAAENERLRAALRLIAGLEFGDERGSAEDIARAALEEKP